MEEALLLSRDELSALYQGLQAVKDALDKAKVPWTLTGGSVLGAVRSESVLFCDDDIDLAIIGREYLEVARRALEILGGFWYKRAGGRNGLCWDRLRSKKSPAVWIDVFLLEQYASLEELRAAVSTKRNGMPQDDSIVAAAIGPSAKMPKEAWPLYHFADMDPQGGAGLAIQLWPKELFPATELPFREDGVFGPLRRIPLPGMPLRYLMRAFGPNCFAEYVLSSEHQQYRQGKRQETSGIEGANASSGPFPLLPEHYVPVMPCKKDQERASGHNLEQFRRKLVVMAKSEGLAEPPKSCKAPPEQDGLLTQASRAILKELNASSAEYDASFFQGSLRRSAQVILGQYERNRVLVCSNGPTGEFWHGVALELGLHSLHYRLGAGVTFAPEIIAQAAASHDCKAVVLVHLERCCGVINPVNAIAEACLPLGIACFADVDASLSSGDISMAVSGDRAFLAAMWASVTKDVVCCITARKNAITIGHSGDVEEGAISQSLPLPRLSSYTLSGVLEKSALGAGGRLFKWNGFGSLSVTKSCTTYIPPSGVCCDDMYEFLQKINQQSVRIDRATGCLAGHGIVLSAQRGATPREDFELIANQIHAYSTATLSRQSLSELAPEHSRLPLLILAAGMGTRLRNSCGLDMPKCLVDINGQSILERMVNHAAASNLVQQIVIVVGYQKALVEEHARRYCSQVGLPLLVVENPDFASTNTSKSVLFALRAEPDTFQSGCLLVDGDLVCHQQVFHRVASFPGSCAAVSRPTPFDTLCTDEEAVRVRVANSDSLCTAIGKGIGPGFGEAIGLYRIDYNTLVKTGLESHLESVQAHEYYEDAFQRAIAHSSEDFGMFCIDVTGLPCVEVDTAEDYASALRFHNIES